MRWIRQPSGARASCFLERTPRDILFPVVAASKHALRGSARLLPPKQIIKTCVMFGSLASVFGKGGLLDFGVGAVGSV